ncbi:MAG TPA: hypothetical protein VKF14_15195 [Candidatus Dormibacteraeota bacterium]|nr:hypothetical protein [Candidatus Dormibacteraeota bacterium]
MATCRSRRNISAGETAEQAVQRLLDARVEQGFEPTVTDHKALATIASLLGDSVRAQPTRPAGRSRR